MTSATSQHVAHAMQKVPRRSTSTFVNIAGTPVPQCFLEFAQSTIDRCDRCRRNSRDAVEKPLARTLSRKLLAIKKFSCVTALASHRRSPKPDFSDESRPPIRTRAFSRDRRVSDRDERSMHACVHRSRRHDDARRPVTGRFQMPSLAFSRSLTACGLALPPDDFITWPTNQPASCGLAFACATLSGLAAMMSSTTFSIAPKIGDLLHAARFDQRARVAALRARRSRTGPWRSCRRWCPRRSGRRSRRAAPPTPARPQCPGLPC